MLLCTWLLLTRIGFTTPNTQITSNIWVAKLVENWTRELRKRNSFSEEVGMRELRELRWRLRGCRREMGTKSQTQSRRWQNAVGSDHCACDAWVPECKCKPPTLTHEEISFWDHCGPHCGIWGYLNLETSDNWSPRKKVCSLNKYKGFCWYVKSSFSKNTFNSSFLSVFFPNTVLLGFCVATVPFWREWGNVISNNMNITSEKHYINGFFSKLSFA